jgi:transcriptional regulator with XRE-family HTH domain
MSRKPNTFTEQLRRLIEASDKTRYRISKETQIAEGQLSRFVHGKAGLSLSAIDRICDCLNLKLIEIRTLNRKRGR